MPVNNTPHHMHVCMSNCPCVCM